MKKRALPMAVERLPLATSSSPKGVPADIISEQALIGCCLYGGSEIFLEVANAITSEVFYDQEFRMTFEIMRELADNGFETGLVEVVSAFRKKYDRSPAKSVWCAMEFMAHPRSWPYFKRSVVECFEKRTMMLRAKDALETAKDPERTAAEARAAIDAATLDSVAENAVTHGERLACSTEQFLEERYLLKGGTPGIATGFNKLDSLTGGLMPGEYSVIAARPSEGKSAMGMTLIHQVALKRRIPTLFISLEMPLQSVMARFASMETNIEYSSIRRGTFSKADLIPIQRFLLQVRNSPLFMIDGTAMTSTEIAQKIRHTVKVFGIRLVVVDYLQKVRPTVKGDNRARQIAEVSDALKNVAKRHNVHVCGLAQVNRESAKEGRPPRVHEIADSDGIERDADLILILHRPKNKDGIRSCDAKLVVAKQREGEQGVVDLHFAAEFVRFDECSVIPSI